LSQSLEFVVLELCIKTDVRFREHFELVGPGPKALLVRLKNDKRSLCRQAVPETI